MKNNPDTFKNFSRHRHTWLITGVAGFIGSHLLEELLNLNQKVVGLDNFFTGSKKNLGEVKKSVAPEQWKNFHFIEGDIRDLNLCQRACHGVDYVLHQAALGSVPRSVDDPVLTNSINVDGTFNVLLACRDNKVKRIVFASSSAVYGDDETLPKQEHLTGRQLSPYAVTKYMDEFYAQNFAVVYGLECVGLRYFNVFGPRQDPNGAYAAVIPKWIQAMLMNQSVIIFGKGEHTRDFCYIKDVVRANLLAALTTQKNAINQIYNIACGKSTDLIELFDTLKSILSVSNAHIKNLQPQFENYRQGDILHSAADISRAKEFLRYTPAFSVRDGLIAAMGWYQKDLGSHSP